MMKVPTEGDFFARLEARIDKVVLAQVEALVEVRMKMAYEKLVENLQDRTEQLLNAQKLADRNESVALVESIVDAKMEIVNDRITKQDKLIQNLQREQTKFESIIANLQNQVEQLLNAQKLSDTNERSAVKDINSKVNAPWRNCEEIRAADPTATSGNYQIDPDGWTVGDGLISVFCDMTTGN